MQVLLREPLSLLTEVNLSFADSGPGGEVRSETPNANDRFSGLPAIGTVGKGNPHWRQDFCLPKNED